METLRCLQFGARYLVVGWASTPNVGGSKGRRGAPAANTLPTNLMLMKGLNVKDICLLLPAASAGAGADVCVLLRVLQLRCLVLLR